MRADILLPGFKITADPRVDRRLVIGLDVARQNEALLGRAAGDVREGNSWDCLCVRPGYKVLIADGLDRKIVKSLDGAGGESFKFTVYSAFVRGLSVVIFTR